MFEEVDEIKKVTEDGEYYYIDLKDFWSFSLSKEYKIVPEVGDIARVYIKNGSTVRGLDLNGIYVFYKTDEQLEEEHRVWCESYNKEKQEQFEKEKSQLDLDYESLPDVFKKRIDRFRKNNPNFRVEYEVYEMFCCKEAIKIAGALKTSKEIQKFHDLPWEEQIELVDIDKGHSGNTFGCACVLACAYLDAPNRIIDTHGSLSPLVGSKAFGDI